MTSNSSTFDNPHGFPWWNCEKPGCKASFNTEMTDNCYNCKSPTSQMAKLNAFLDEQSAIESTIGAALRDDDTTDTPQILTSFETHRKNPGFSKSKSSKGIPKGSKGSSRGPYTIPSRSVSASPIVSRQTIPSAHLIDSTPKPMPGVYHFNFMPMTLKPWDELIYEGKGDPSESWLDVNKPEPHVYFRKHIIMTTEEKWPEGEGPEAWENWLKSTFVEEKTSKYMIYRGLPSDLLVDWKLAVYEPFKPGQLPVMWYIEHPNPEQRKIYSSIAEWLNAQGTARNPKINPEGFALVARRPTEDLHWFHAGIHGVDIFGSMKRKPWMIDENGKIIMNVISSVEKNNEMEK